MIQTRAENVNMRVGDKSAEGLSYVLSAKGAQFNASLGRSPRMHYTPNSPSAESAIHFRCDFVHHSGYASIAE